MAEVNDRVKKVVAKVCKVGLADVKDQSDFVKDLGMESLQSIELAASFEEEFDIEIDEDDVADITTVDKATEYIDQAIKKQHC